MRAREAEGAPSRRDRTRCVSLVVGSPGDFSGLTGFGASQGRRFDHHAGTGEIRLCNIVAQAKPCDRPNCRSDHDLIAYLAARPADSKRNLPTSSDDLTPTETSHACPLFLSLGACPYGFKCRFGESHMRKLEDGQGFQGCGWELVVDEEKVNKRESEAGEGKGKLSGMAEMNLITTMQIKEIRGGGKTEVRSFAVSPLLRVTLIVPFPPAGEVPALGRLPQVHRRAARHTRGPGQGRQGRQG